MPNDLKSLPDPSSEPASETADWRVLLKKSVVRPGDLPAVLRGAGDARNSVAAAFPMRINPYFLNLIRRADDALGRQVIPDPIELEDLEASADPLGEDAQSPVSQVIHRYPHRVAFQVSNQCAVYCRFCMRKRRVGLHGQVSDEGIARGAAYIGSHPEINEVVLTGGDPLMLDDERLLSLLGELHAIAHVKWLRIHTRVPSVLPQRITPVLAACLGELRPLFINIHFNHPAEVTPQAASACGLLADAGIPLGSQTVLLRGVNDDFSVLSELMEKLMMMRVRPYYLHQLDRVPGTAHFRVGIEESLRLLRALRGPLSGMAIPHLMIDLPGGGGKVALTPESVVRKGDKLWQVRNWQGKVYDYPVD
jgi:lysine 2,3-aminomutase